MSSVASDLIGRIKKAWAGLTPTMRWLAIGMLLAVITSIGVTWYLRLPRWEAFYRANDPTELTSLTERLDELQVKYRITGDGLTVSVPSSELSAANLAKAQAGLPSGGNVGLEIFAEPRFGATEFDKKVNYERAAEGELARALMRIRDIEYAVVNLNMPEQSVFIRDRQPASASVLVEPRVGRTLSKDTVRAIMNFVASAVDGLEPERVTVLSSQGVELSRGIASEDAAAGASPETIALQRQREQELTEKVLDVLEPVFGRGNVAATVTVELEHQTVRTEERIIGQSVPRSTITESQATQVPGSTAGAAATGTAGAGETEAEVTPPPIYQELTTTAPAESYTTRSETQYDVGERNQVTVSPAGSIKRVSAAITINREELTLAQVDQIRQLAANATGAAISDVSVVAMSFTRKPTDGAPEAEPARPLIDPRALAVGLAAASILLLVAFILARRRRPPEPEFALAGVPGQPLAGTTLDVALGLDTGREEAAAAAAEGAPKEEAAVKPEAPDGKEVAKKLEEVLHKRERRRPGLEPEDFAEDDILVDIDVLIEQAPEACAEVIRQWLKGGL